MSRRHLRAVLPALALVLASPALAAGGEGESGTSTSELVWQALNLALLLGIIVFAARKPVQAFFAERRERISQSLDDSAELLREAEGHYAEWQRKLVELDTELERIRAMARQRANEERDRILSDARSGAERIRSEASAAIQQEVRRAETELRHEASALAVELATRLLEQQVGEADRGRLVDEFIAEIEGRASADPSEGRA